MRALAGCASFRGWLSKAMRGGHPVRRRESDTKPAACRRCGEPIWSSLRTVCPSCRLAAATAWKDSP